MAGALFLSLRVSAGKGVWSGRGARKVCPGYSFVKILSPKDPPKKEARGGFQKGSGRRGSGEGGTGGEAPKKGIEGTRKRCGRVRKAIQVCPGYTFVRFAARCLFSRARSRVFRGSQQVAKAIGNCYIL